ncbi:hypothetical protein [Pyrolobus fumarii]|nr:hypothetical protein [Pyrolobus fumarii]
MGGPEQYKSCSFFVEQESGEEAGAGGTPAITSFAKSGLEKKLKPYPPIHLLDYRPNNECPFMKVYEYSGGYLAYCTVLERLLTRSEVETCEQHWKTCPVRRVGVMVGRRTSETTA